ncbi:MAG TPA: tetratricopeptide repeat protein [Sedimentisphaerales bacterium]|nr:tetratricopeptide repeat protein [Sedimentisphaerales bacterium]
MDQLGRMYEEGKGVAKDDSKAAELYRKVFESYRKAAEAGDIESMCSLGIKYANGQRVPKDYVKAVKWFCKAAELGDIAAMMSLGFIYGKNQIAVKDLEIVIEILRIAAEGGNVIGMNNLALTYTIGNGVPKDYKKATEWYRSQHRREIVMPC